ncbi:MAG: TetR family transcriptional regulator [Galbitalea sp.]
MTTAGFARARNDEQRAERHEAILTTAATMLAHSRVNDLSLNALARQVGLAKSNVLRYFESREAVLLELYERETTAWLDSLEAALASAERVDAEVVARAIAEQAAARPVFCDLTASAAGVLEHNVSADVAANYKRDAIASAYRLAAIVGSRLGGFTEAEGIVFVGGVNLAIGGVWASSQPSRGMAAAYRAHPDLRDFRLDFRFAVSELIATLLVGLEHREPRSP